MTGAARFYVIAIVLVTVVFGIFLTTAALALHVLRHQETTSVTLLVAHDSRTLATAVPTVGPLNLSLLPATQPTSPADPDIQSPPEMPVSIQPTVPLRIMEPLVDPPVSLLTGPVYVPLEIHIPALEIKAPVLGVGLTAKNAMAAPLGNRPEDPVWQSVFWYRGSGIPGDVGTATFAGHFDDTIGRPAVFAYLGDIRIGDLVVVRDKRSGIDIPFIVTEAKHYTEQEATDPAVLARIFGSSPARGEETQPVFNQHSHLTLITCGGAWVKGSFSLRLVIYATRASYPL